MALLFSCLFIILHALCWGAVPSEKMGVTFPIDERTWVPLYPSLPFGQDTIWFAPKGASIERGEYLILKKFPDGSTLKDMSYGIGIESEERPYGAQHGLDDSFAIAFEGSRNFTVDHVFKSENAVYHVHYVVPNRIVDKQCKMEWWGRLKQEGFAKATDFLRITPQRIYCGLIEVTPPDNWMHYQHSVAPFSIELPPMWAFMETKNNEKKTVDGPGFTQCLGFSRLDELAVCTVAISTQTSQPTKKQIDIEWNNSIREVQRLGGPEIVDQGDFENSQGGHDKYLIMRDGDMTCWKLFHWEGLACYRIDCWTDTNNFPMLREPFHKILYSFSVGNPMREARDIKQ